MRSAEIIDALLTLSRAGREAYRAEWVDLNMLVQRIAASYQSRLEALDGRLVVHPLPTVVIIAPSFAIHRVFVGQGADLTSALDYVPGVGFIPSATCHR